MRDRLVRSLLVAIVVAACGNGAPAVTSAPSAAAIATATSTAIPSATVIVTNPPPTPIPGCLPECRTGQLRRPGALSGEYTTHYFFGGRLTVRVPEGWYGYEDSTGELSIGPTGSEESRLEIWLDVYPVTDPIGSQDMSFVRSAKGVTAFVTQEQGIEILKRAPATIGGLPAEAFVYRRAADAKTQDPGCPSELQPCIVEFGYPEWDAAFSEGGPFHSRLVIAKATWGGQTHAIYAMFWSDDAQYDALVATAQAVVEGARLPEGVGP